MTEDLQNIEMSWTDYKEIADNWAVWNGCVVQHAPRTRGRIKVRSSTRCVDDETCEFQ